MTKKTFSWNFKNRKFNESKVVSNEVLNVSYVRDFLDESPEIKVVDNFSNVSDLFLKKKESLKYKLGISTRIKTMTLKSVFWDKIQLKMPFLAPKKKKNLITNLKINLLASPKKLKKKIVKAKILKPIKNGFKIEYFGINGFLSQKRYKSLKNTGNFKETVEKISKTENNKKTQNENKTSKKTSIPRNNNK